MTEHQEATEGFERFIDTLTGIIQHDLFPPESDQIHYRNVFDTSRYVDHIAREDPSTVENLTEVIAAADTVASPIISEEGRPLWYKLLTLPQQIAQAVKTYAVQQGCDDHKADNWYAATLGLETVLGTALALSSGASQEAIQSGLAWIASSALLDYVVEGKHQALCGSPTEIQRIQQKQKTLIASCKEKGVPYSLLVDGVRKHVETKQRYALAEAIAEEF